MLKMMKNRLSISARHTRDTAVAAQHYIVGDRRFERTAVRYRQTAADFGWAAVGVADRLSELWGFVSG
jgi:hypothetical protein